MKKYVKPELYFESFQLSQHIAACGYDQLPKNDAFHQSKPEECAFAGDVELGNIAGNYFMDPDNGCVIINLDRYCYTNGTDNPQIRIFNS